MKRIISLLLAVLLMAGVLAGCSGETEEEVTPGADMLAPVVLGETPVVLRQAVLNFNPDRMKLKDGIGWDWTDKDPMYILDLTLVNPKDEPVEVRLAMPVQAPIETGEDPMETMKAAASEITLVDENSRIAPQLHTATYPAMQVFDPVLFAPMMDSERYAQGDFDPENLTVTKYVYIGKGISDVLGLPAFRVPINTDTQRLVVQGGFWNAEGELWARPFSDYTEVDFDLDGDLLFGFFVIGEELTEEPVWSYNEGADLTADGVVQLVQKSTLTFDELMLNPQLEACLDGAGLVPGGTYENDRRPVYRQRMLEVLQHESWEGIARADWFGGNTLYWLEYTLTLEPGMNVHDIGAPAYPDTHVDFEPNKYDYTVDARTLNTWANCESFFLCADPGEIVLLESTPELTVDEGLGLPMVHYDGAPEEKLRFTLCPSSAPELKFKLRIPVFGWGLIALGIAAAAIIITGRMRYAKKLKLAKEGKKL